MCNSPASDFGWREPGLLHTAVLEKWANHFNSFFSSFLVINGTPCSLTPGQRYYYVYGDYYGWSSEKSFKAAPSSKVDITSTVIAFGGQSGVMWYPQPVRCVVTFSTLLTQTWDVVKRMEASFCSTTYSQIPSTQLTWSCNRWTAEMSTSFFTLETWAMPEDSVLWWEDIELWLRIYGGSQ